MSNISLKCLQRPRRSALVSPVNRAKQDMDIKLIPAFMSYQTQINEKQGNPTQKKRFVTLMNESSLDEGQNNTSQKEV
jgi:hypothetical protein